MNGFKISDIDQLILALRFRFGVFSSKIMDVKFCRVFIKYTHKSKKFPLVFLYELLISF